MAYDAAYMMFDAIERSGAPLTAPNCAMRWRRPKIIEGVTGSITIDENRNAQKPIVILKSSRRQAELRQRNRDEVKEMGVGQLVVQGSDEV